MSRTFHRVAVLMGGPSREREVSLRSGAAVTRGLEAAGYRVAPVDVTGYELTLPEDVDAAFIALHGAFGEDGTLQAVLRDRGLPYTGSGPEASRRAMDKILSRDVFAAAGLPVAPAEVLGPKGRTSLPLPVVLKPPCEGSSIGIEFVHDAGEWEAALERTLAYGERVYVEAFVPGRELTVGIVGEEALPVLEIHAPEGNYNYQAKYTAGRTRYTVPAALTAAETGRLQEAALGAFRALDCRGLARVDFRMTPAGEIAILELNSIPGFTETSLLPKAAAARGLDFSSLCDRILREAAVDAP